MLKHGKFVGRSLRAHLIFKVPFSASECCFPLIALIDPNLVVGVAQVDFGEDLGFVEPIQHFRYEGEGIAIFYCDFVETPIVDHKAKLAIWLRHEHKKGRGWRFGGAYDVRTTSKYS